MNKEKRIPRAKIEEGIKFSLQKAEKHLGAAELLIENSFPDNAVAAIEFAIEEFGRAIYLRERLNKGLETIENTLETSHKLKYDKAFSVLSQDLKTIWEDTLFSAFPKGYWPKGYWPEGYWGERIVKETISPHTRLRHFYTL